MVCDVFYVLVVDWSLVSLFVVRCACCLLCVVYCLMLCVDRCSSFVVVCCCLLVSGD